MARSKEHLIRMAIYKKEWYKDRRKTVFGKATLLLQATKRQCKAKHIEFNLELTDIIKQLIWGRCKVTGRKFDYDGEQHNPFAPSIDGIDPKKGYIKGNIQLVIWMYNRAKGQDNYYDVLLMAYDLVAKEQERMLG